MAHPAEQERRKGETKVVGVRLPMVEFKALQRVADSEERSVSAQIRYLVKQGLEGRENSWSQ